MIGWTKIDIQAYKEQGIFVLPFNEVVDDTS